MFEMLSQASLFAKFSLLVGLSPLGLGLAYAVRPTELRLALMRPLSLAGIFAGLSGSLLGAINVLSMLWTREAPVPLSTIAVGAAESLVPMFVAFGALMVAWLLVTVGLGRQG